MGGQNKVNILVSSRDYFLEVIGAAMEKRKVSSSPFAKEYLVKLLDFYVSSSELEIKYTFAETFLRAQQEEKAIRHDLLRKVGDTSLYLAGFFGDSLRRKIVDIDYYAEMGGLAYASLAHEMGESAQAEVYYDFSKRFFDYVDVLTYISQSALIQSNQDLLRLYERYVTTGSELAREQLVEKGLIASEQIKKTSNQ